MNRALVLQVKALSKAFPGVQALNDVHLEVERGQVHALVGENGAGKSTLMKILAGLYRPDTGEIWLKGEAVRIKSPHDALKRGLAMIHQELQAFPNLTVAENILIGQEPVSTVPGWIDRKGLNQKAEALLQRLNLQIAPTAIMRELTVAQMQGVEIAKALSYGAEVIMMDEPTSALSAREVAALFDTIRELKKRGVAIVYVSHKLEEIYQIADCVTVLRDGSFVASRPIAHVTRDELIALMVGRELLDSRRQKTCAPNSKVALAVRGLGKTGKFENVSFDLHCGEVLGVGGLMGAGRTDLIHAIYGLAPADTGEIIVNGRKAHIDFPSDALAQGIALVSEDRKKFGLVLELPVKENLTLSSLRQFCRAMFIDGPAENRAQEEIVRNLTIKTSGRKQPVLNLSGGNQQKVVLGKALLTKPDILLLDEPTRGIDIGAKAEIYEMIAKLACAGKAILLVSSELPELLFLSNRILVMRQGVIAAELDSAKTSQEQIMKFAMPGGERRAG